MFAFVKNSFDSSHTHIYIYTYSRENNEFHVNGVLKNSVEWKRAKMNPFSLPTEQKVFEEEAEFVPFYVIIKLNVPPRRKWRGCAPFR